MPLRSLKNKNKILVTAKDYYTAMQKALPKEAKESYTVTDAYNDMQDMGEPVYIDGSVQPVWEIPESKMPRKEEYGG